MENVTGETVPGRSREHLVVEIRAKVFEEGGEAVVEAVVEKKARFCKRGDGAI